MTKSDLINVVANKAGLPKTKVLESIDALTEAIQGALKKGGKVTLLGFGTFSVAKRTARAGVNPRTKEKIKIKASKTPRFKAGKAFKEVVNK